MHWWTQLLEAVANIVFTFVRKPSWDLRFAFRNRYHFCLWFCAIFVVSFAAIIVVAILVIVGIVVLVVVLVRGECWSASKKKKTEWIGSIS